MKQTQRVGGDGGRIRRADGVVISTVEGSRSVPIRISKAEETFNFPVNGAPLNVLFDKGSRILKSVDFKKAPAEWIYQLQHAEDAVDRAVAADALGDVKDNPCRGGGAGRAAQSDAFWGVRVQALTALGRIGGAKPASRCWRPFPMPNRGCANPPSSNWAASRTRPACPIALRKFLGDDAYRVRAAALNSYAQLKPRSGLALLQDAAKTDSPDDVIRRAALRAMGPLGDDKAVSTLLDWSEEGKPIALRTAAIASLAQLDKKNEDIGKRLTALLDDQAFDIRSAAVNALGDRDDASAVPALEAMLRRTRLPVNFSNVIQRAIDRLKHVNPEADPMRRKRSRRGRRCGAGAAGDVAQRLGRVEQTLTEVNDRLKRIEEAALDQISAAEALRCHL